MGRVWGLVILVLLASALVVVQGLAAQPSTNFEPPQLVSNNGSLVLYIVANTSVSVSYVDPATGTPSAPVPLLTQTDADALKAAFNIQLQALQAMVSTVNSSLNARVDGVSERVDALGVQTNNNISAATASLTGLLSTQVSSLSTETNNNITTAVNNLGNRVNMQIGMLSAETNNNITTVAATKLTASSTCQCVNPAFLQQLNTSSVQTTTLLNRTVSCQDRGFLYSASQNTCSLQITSSLRCPQPPPAIPNGAVNSSCVNMTAGSICNPVCSPGTFLTGFYICLNGAWGGTPSCSNSPPVWITPSGFLGTLTAGSPSMSQPSLALSSGGQLLASDPEAFATTFSVTAGTLPPGITLLPSGALSGSASLPSFDPSVSCPAFVNTYSFTVVASDGVAQVSRSFSITVAALAKQQRAVFTIVGSYSWLVPAQTAPIIEVLVVGGGGGGGSRGGGGGGAGGLIYTTNFSVVPGVYIPVTVGAGGVGGAAGTIAQPGTPGGSSAFGLLNAVGGLGGSISGGGGDGAGGPGQPGFCNSSVTSNGGAGVSYFNLMLAAGGGGGCSNTSQAAGLAGNSSAGAGSLGAAAAGNAVASSGSGGGGGGFAGLVGAQGGNGGSGIVIIEWCSVFAAPNVPPLWVTSGGSLGTLTTNNMYASALSVSQLLAQDAEDLPLTYSVMSGSLPPGLSLTSSGLVTGVALPLASPVNGCANPSQVFSFTVSVFDGLATVSQNFSISVVTTAVLRNTTFLSSSSWSPPSSRLSVLEILLVGGGGGGACRHGGGGGAGGVVYTTSYNFNPGLFVPVTVGNGGTGGPAGIYAYPGTSGTNTVFDTLVAYGGGGGGGLASGAGGSGSGASGFYTAGAGFAGQGFSGGIGCGSGAEPTFSGGGGGGAGGAAVAATCGTNSAGGNGGAGVSYWGQLYATGGGGGCSSLSTNVAGLGGNNSALGNFGSKGTNPAGNGPSNTGAGGGGAGLNGLNNGQGGSGGSGIAIVRWCELAGTAPTWNTPAGSLGTLSTNLTAAALTITQLSATDANGAPLTYSLVRDSNLPAGLVLTPSGAITGTAALPSISSTNMCIPTFTSTFSVNVFNGAFFSTRTFSITINPVLNITFRNATFLASGPWTVPPRVYQNVAEVLVVGGGGGGGSRHAGGGGAGGVVYNPATSVLPNQVITVTVGSGGNGAGTGTPFTGTAGTRGQDSSFGSIVVASGGGAGGGGSIGYNGGSGGGGAGFGVGGLGIPGQGNNGAQGCGTGAEPNYVGGGGGGAGSAAPFVTCVNPGNGGNGGNGTSYFGLLLAAGGGGGISINGGNVGLGGFVGSVMVGGSGSKGTVTAMSAPNNSGSGGGGGGLAGSPNGAGGRGGSGIVVVRWCESS